VTARGEAARAKMEENRKRKAVPASLFLRQLDRVADMIRAPEPGLSTFAERFLVNLEQLRTLTRRALHFGVVADTAPAVEPDEVGP
jgi:hypothetical protein